MMPPRASIWTLVTACVTAMLETNQPGFRVLLGHWLLTAQLPANVLSVTRLDQGIHPQYVKPAADRLACRIPNPTQVITHQIHAYSRQSDMDVGMTPAM